MLVGESVTASTSLNMNYWCRTTIGIRLLCKLGWKEGQGIGPRIRKKRRQKRGILSVIIKFVLSEICTCSFHFCRSNIRLVALKRAAEDREGWRHRERMSETCCLSKKKMVHTLDIAPLHSESPPQKHWGMARVLEGFHSFVCTPTRSSAIGMSHTCLCLPSYN